MNNDNLEDGHDHFRQAGAYVRDHSVDLIDLWENQARHTISPARKSSTYALRNHLEELLVDLSEALVCLAENTDQAREAANNNFTLKLSQLHAKNRNRSGNYRVHDVLEEYIVLRHVVTDELTKQKLVSREVTEVIVRLFERSCLEAVREFQNTVDQNQQKILASLAHDLRSPLAVANMSLQAVNISLHQPTVSDQTKDFLQMASNAVHRSLDMSSTMLNSLRKISANGLHLEFAEQDITAFLRATVDEARHLYGRRLIFKPAEFGELRGVFAQELVRRVVENLISNAFKYGSPNEEITVILRDLDDAIELAVHNFGNEIPEAKQKKVFELFNTDGDANQGTGNQESWGLGLVHVNFVARAHGGFAELKSTPTEGTTFSLHLKKNSHKPGHQFITFGDNEPDQTP